MEEKQLDYDQPFLSVRRFTSTVTPEINEKTKLNKEPPSTSSIPNYRSELKSSAVSNPGSVPFVWEKSPGRPKYENEQPAHSFEQPPIAPRLPPGRLMEVKDQAPSKVSDSSSPTSCECQRCASGSLNYSSLHEITEKVEASKHEIEEKASSDAGDNEEAYQDALDTFSRAESIFINCSLSGLSELDEPEVKPSGTFLTDPQTRDFMMGRFLPAAKAIAGDSPQSTCRKPAVIAEEQPKLLADVMGGNKKPPVYHSKPNTMPNYAEVYREEESEDEDDDYDEPGYLSTRACGLLPRFCLLSHVPGVKVRTRAPKPPVSRRQIRSSSAISTLETMKEGTGVAIQEQISADRDQKPELSEYNQSTRSNNQKLDGISLYRRLQGTGESPHENKLPQSRFYKEAIDVENDSFNREKRCADTFEELSGHQRTKRDIGSAIPMVKRTLYVDSVHKLASPEMKSVSSNLKELEDSINIDAVISKVMGFEAKPLASSVCKDIEYSKIMEENGRCVHKSDFDSKQLSVNLKVPDNDDLVTENQQKLKYVGNQMNSYEMDLQFLIPPPLPKSPSESWLRRNFPSVSSKNSTSRSFLSNKVNFPNDASKVPSGDFKWETIVRSTKMQHQHALISEELSTPASKT